MLRRFEELKTVFTLIVIMWVGFFLSLSFPINRFGIIPRQIHGLYGIFLAPFLHGSLSHILMNTTSLLTFGFIYAMVKAKDTLKTCLWIIIFSGFFTWLIGRPAVHIGASGLVFGLYGYLVAHGWYSKKFIAFFTSFALIFVYGGILFGLLPGRPQISWEAHLFGFLGGIALARYRNQRRPTS